MLAKGLTILLFPIFLITGCGPFVEVIRLDEETTEKLKSEVKIYWDRNELADNEYAYLGPLKSTSCMNKLWDGPPSEEDAMNQLRHKAILKGGNGILAPSCEEWEGTSLNKNCWASITCHGVAIKVGAKGVLARTPPKMTRREESRVAIRDLQGTLVEDLAKQLSTGITKHHIIRIAVLPLSDASHEANRPLGNYLTEKLTTALYKTGSAKVVERSQLDKVIEELHLTMSGRFDEASVQRIGKLLGVDAVIVGSYTELGTHTVEVNSRVIHVETGEIVGVGTVQIPTGAVEPLLR